MKLNITKTLLLILSLVPMIILSGCTTGKKANSKAIASTIKITSDENIKILWADSYQQEDGKVVICGALKRKKTGSVPMKGHLDIQVLSENGDLLKTVSSEDIYIPRNLVGKGIKSKRFKVVLQDVSSSSNFIISVHQA